MARIEFLWFEGCPGHAAARALLAQVVAEIDPETTIVDVDASAEAVAVAWRFPGSPTIRVDGVDIDPGYRDPGDYTPRCRLYPAPDGPRGVPPRAWIEGALRASRS